MKQLELLAPARNSEIGIAAIDCGADAVYIAGPKFGARQAAGNSIEDIRTLCSYAHKYGVRIFVTLNTIIYDDELEDAYRQMLQVQEAGADALIIQDLAVLKMAREGIGGHFEPLKIPLHASTQCAIRTPEQAIFLESLGFSRLILERELSLEQIRAIRKAVSCELEFFVHGALCVCYSGQCYLSEKIAGRSANRGACIQACRSRYDLVDENGKVIVRDKALLSLKDYNLRNRLSDLAEAGISSFKIEGRLKNESYVRNVVRDYSLGLDNLVAKHPGTYSRSSYGSVSGGFSPDTNKTFNRGYTELFIDGKRGKWASMDAAKGMGEEIGTVAALNKDCSVINIRPVSKNIKLNNGDGFSFVGRDGNVTGFRGDVCSDNVIRSKSVPSLYNGARIFRNINAAFEKDIERQACTREISAGVAIHFADDNEGSWTVAVKTLTEDGREVRFSQKIMTEAANNRQRMKDIIENQISKTSGHYRFHIEEITSEGNEIPFLTASFLNGLRRSLAEELDRQTCCKNDLFVADLSKVNPSALPYKIIDYKANVANGYSRFIYAGAGADKVSDAYELTHCPEAELMRTKYCIRYELNMCPVHQKASQSGPLFLLNNGQKFALHFDCRNCEMTVTEVK